MNTTAIALLGYIGLMIILVGFMIVIRVGLTVSGKRKANSFLPTGEDVSPFAARLSRVHANCYEHFPIFGGLLIFSLATGQSDVTNGLAIILIAARIAQSIIHLISTRMMAVNLRFAAFLTQYVIAAIWAWNFAALYL